MVELLDVDRGEDVLLDHLLRDDDGVLEVVPLPGHERHEDVLAERQLAALRGGAVGQQVALLHLHADRDAGLLGDVGVLVGPAELDQRVRADGLFERRVGVLGRLVVADGDLGRVDVLDHAVALGDEDSAAVTGDAALQTRADVRRGRLEKGHGLALHVRAHERAVGVIVLEERDQARRGRDDLVRRHVHVVDLVRRHQRHVAADAGADQLVGVGAVLVERRVGLRDRVAVLVLGGEVLDLLGDLAVLDLPVRRLDEAELVHDAVGAQRRDEADVRAFRRLDRAETAVVRVVHVADLEAGALTGQTTRPERGHPTLVRQLRERVGLVHELRQLVRPEEGVDHRRDGPRVDEVLGREFVRVAEVHPLLDRPRHAGEAERELALELLADGPHAAVAEVVDVVDVRLAVLQLDQLGDDRDDVLLGQRHRVVLTGQPEPLVHAVPADGAEVVALVGEEEAVEERTGGVHIGRLGAAERLVEVLERLVRRVRRVLLDRVEERRHVERRVVVLVHLAAHDDRRDVGVLQDAVVVLGELVLGREDDLALGGLLEHLARVLIDHLVLDLHGDRGGQHAADQLRKRLLGRHLLLVGEVEQVDDLGVRRVAQAAQERRDGQLLLAVDVRPHHVRDVGRELDPRAPEGDHAGAVQVRPVGVDRLREEDTGAAVQLADNDSLGAVDDERALLGHDREVAEVDILLDRLFGLVLVLVLLGAQAQLGLEREGERQALREALLDGVLGRLQREVEVLERVALASVRDREVLPESGFQPLLLVTLLRDQLRLEEVVVGLELDLEEVRKVEDRRDVCEGLASAFAAGRRSRRALAVAQGVPLGCDDR